MTAPFDELPDDDARALLAKATETAAWQLRHAVADGQTPVTVMLTAMLSAAVTAKALEMSEEQFLMGCRAAYSSVKVLSHGPQQ